MAIVNEFKNIPSPFDTSIGEGEHGYPDFVPPHLNPLPPRGEEVFGRVFS
jgi:hypothetical protein